MEAKAFLELAEDLSKKTRNEAALRTCVSRSYYGLYNFLAQFVDQYIEPLSKTAKDHEIVYRYLHNCEVDDVEDIADNLDDLREERNDADYNLEENKFIDDPNVAALVCLKARTSFGAFEIVLRDRRKQKRIKEGILRYKKIITP